MKIAVRIYVITKRMLMCIVAAVVALFLLGLAIMLIFKGNEEQSPVAEAIEPLNLSSLETTAESQESRSAPSERTD